MSTATADPEDARTAPRILQVADRRQEATDVVSLVLRSPEGPLPTWSPGAHIELVLDSGLVRQYSLCGDPQERATWRVAVLHEQASRGGSRAVHERLHPGTAVLARGPRNAFALVDAPAYLFVAGGIGITPVLAMVREVSRRGVPWRLAYGGRTRASMAFVEEVQAMSQGGRVEVAPLDTHGPLPVAELVAWADAAGADVYCCGPAGLIDAVESEGAARLGPGRVHVERFRQDDGPADASSLARDRPFEIEVASHGLTVTVPAERTALEALEEAGVPILSSCRAGTCGTCELAVVEGEVDHRDSLLTPAERAAHDTMFPCVSRAVGRRLVVEL